MNSLFVTGAGTGVGKTFVTAALLTQLLRRSVTCHALKPVVTGFAAGAETDTALLLAAQGRSAGTANVDALSPWRFKAPLSPDVAATREQRIIDFNSLVRFCTAPHTDQLRLIEGVGGVMVPLTSEATVLDWIEAVGAPSVLVGGSYLGALSHTLTALQVLQERRCKVACVIVSQSADEPMPTVETAASLRQHTDGVPVHLLPRVSLGETEQLPDMTEWIAGCY